MKKKINKKLTLNKQKISELSQGNLGEVKGGKPDSWGFACVKKTFGWKCEWVSELYTACHCDRTREFKGCDIESIGFACEA